ncbi:MAG: glycine cleavage system aminomethyltransferase GcvT [Actinobacteria bacterium]|nr:glycine cleavage system aminomethyltransferase GcvT [Actinomycetota bacterium]
MPLRQTALHSTHLALDAKMVPFGGWDMPVSYPRGTIEEHMTCRRFAVMFDVSHLGTVRLEGAGSFGLLQAVLTNDLTKVAPGRAQYTHLLDPDDASVIDDIIVWWVEDEVFDVMPNASNTERVVRYLGGFDTTATRSVIAVQGPAARNMVAHVSPQAAAVGRFLVERVEVCGASCVVAGTGYTGEDGIEIAVPNDHASVVWDALMAAGVVPAGLGARDTLRLEAGLPLHGFELGAGITPLQANLNWVVGWKKRDFQGRAPLLAEKERGVERVLRGISTEGRRPSREGSVVHTAQGDGVVTSGNFSPVLGHGIAMAFLPPPVVEGEVVQIDVRGAALAGRVVALPFVRKSASGA